ncbi:Adenylate cyclase [hydrothermal vent metagenome]|uniref:Adenylate cyclase n=1 Tax=hydrothermal vent metagenome TaxID=652676 RepID=A0A3B0ZD26_9ZZZZ
MDILEEFKKMADQKRQDLEQSGQDRSGLHTVRSMQVVASLQTIHNYLHDLIEQLNFVETDIHTTLNIDGMGKLEDLHHNHYRLINESSIKKESISLLFSMKNDSQLEIDIDDTIETRERIEELKTLGLLINYISKTPPRIGIQGHIPVRIEFESDFEESSIHITIENFSRLAKEHYMLNVDNISDELLNDFANYILRRDNKFMDVLIEDSHGISLIQRQHNPDEQENTVRTEEMDISRLRSIFNREHRLYLTYHNDIRDLGSRTHGYILGRAKDCDLMVKSDLSSRHHAQLVYRKGKFVLIDQSTNGTFVKAQGGKEVYVQGEETPLSGSGFISLGKAVTVDNEHLIYYSCQ